MYKQFTLIFTTLLITNAQAETANDLKKDYLKFRKNYLSLISSSPTGANFIKYFNNLETELNLQYETFTVKEAKQLTPEGNQMALDIEMLQPIKMLLNGQLDCDKAAHDNEMNTMADESAAAKIKILIGKLCK